MPNNMIMNVQYYFVNVLKLAKDMFAVSANENVDGNKALGITSHPNIDTPSCVHVARMTFMRRSSIDSHSSLAVLC